MTIRLSERLGRLPAYPLAEIPSIKRRLIESGVDVIDLGAGDNDTPPPADVVREMNAALADPAMSKYGFQQGYAGFRRAAADYVARRFGHRFDAATEILPLIGSKEGLAHLPFAFVDPGEVVRDTFPRLHIVGHGPPPYALGPAKRSRIWSAVRNRP